MSLEHLDLGGTVACYSSTRVRSVFLPVGPIDDGWEGVALIVTRKGLNGLEFAAEERLQVRVERVVLLHKTFYEATHMRLRDRFESELDMEVLSRLLRAHLTPGQSRLFLLWMTRCWNCFRPRTCRNCSTTFQSQSHVLECAHLASALNADTTVPTVVPLESPGPPSPALVVEERIRSILWTPSTKSRQAEQLSRLASHLCDAIGKVFGPLDRFTYA